MGSNCRTRGPGVKRNLSVTGFWGGVEPQCVDRRQTGTNRQHASFMHSPFGTARIRFDYQSGANSFLIAGTGRLDFSTNAISSMPSWRISSGAWEQCQPAPTSANLVESKERKAATKRKRGMILTMFVPDGIILNPVARSTSSVSRRASTSSLRSAVERART